MGRGLGFRNWIGLFFILLAGRMMIGPISAWAADTVCARVKIEIKQELTLERQGFDAHMRINNGLANIRLENVKVDVSFADEDSAPVLASSDPDNTDALFFIRLDSMDNISDVDGTGTVGPSSTADIHWLIIPAPGASNGLEKGTLYYVGAKLTYTIGGEQKVTEVTPDYIFVKPMPEITLDYFLPSDVYGDDPFTAEIEPTIPFSLGVRVKNSGHGVASKLKIDSAQPKITENEQGLLIGFAIEGSEVNGQPASDSLLVDFGDISPNSSGMARWIMTCSLSGKFVSFTADFSHSDELGGELTSLIKAVNTHFLVQDVIVDLPGRDAVRDFLARDDSVYRIYESEVTAIGDPEDEDPQVADQSATAVLTGSGDTYTLTTAVTAGYMYVRLTDPFGGQKVLKEVIRSDGKVIKSENAWLSHTRVKNDPWQYFFNLFDVNSPGAYTLKFEDASAVALPPVLQFIAPKTVAEGEQVSFIVEASDPNGTVPKLAASPLPAGAEFVDEGSGRGVFDWTPAEGQAGVYEIIYSATDGILSTTRRAAITVQGFRDADGDGMDDDWEMQHFGSLDRDGRGDFDHDGISDLDEFLNQTDPTGMADIAVRLAADDMSPGLADELILTITATNRGPSAAAGVQVTDLLSSGLRYVSDDADGSFDPATGVWDVGDLAASGPEHTAVLNLTVAVERPGKIINIAALTAAGLYDPDRSNNSAALVLNGGARVDLALAQTTDSPMPDAGDTIIFSLQVSNNGMEDATGVQITDGLPIGLTHTSSSASLGAYDPISGIWDVGDLSAGDSAALMLTLMVADSAEVTHTAVISRIDQPDAEPTNNRCSLVLNQDPENHPYVADLAVYKLVSQSAVNAGEQNAFTLLVRNNGPDDAGSIEVDDLLPDGLVFQTATPSQGAFDEDSSIWQVGAIPAGSYAMMDMIVDVNAAGEQENTAVIGSLVEFDPDPGNDSTTGAVTGLAADIAVTKSVDRSKANVGENFVFAITVTNQGPHDATGVQVVDEVPPGLIYQSHVASRGEFDPATGRWDIDDLAAGDTATAQIILQVEASGEMINTAALDSSGPTDTDSSNSSARVAVIGNAPPQAAIAGSFGGDEGQAIVFSGSATDIDSAELTCLWDFDYNGTFAADVSGIDLTAPQWTYSDNGNYTVALRVEDQDGGISDIVTAEVEINDLAPIAAFTKPASMPEGSTVAFIDTSTSYPDGIVSWHWNFADGTTGSDRNPSHVYQDNGSFTVRLTVTDDDGSQSIVEDTIVITNVAPTVEAGQEQTATEGDVVAFTGSYTDPGADTHTVTWDFGDGTPPVSGTLAPIHIYADDNTYTVTLKVTDDDGGTGTDTLTVTVNNTAPTVAAGEDKKAVEGEPVDFSAAFTDPGGDTHTIEWNFGDGTLLSGTLTPAHTYGDDGTYTVTLTVTDDDGGVGNDTLAVEVFNAAPEISDLTTNSPSNGVISLTAAFTDPGWLDSHSARCEFGDGTAADGDMAQENEKPDATGTLTADHDYTAEGLFTLSVTVTDDDGAGSGPRTMEVLIDKTPPVITVVEPKPGCYHNTGDIRLEMTVVDPESGGVASGLAAPGVVVTLDGRNLASDELLDLSALGDGPHTLYVAASDYAGNAAEHEVSFEVGPVPAMAAIQPQRWNLSWLNPFENGSGNIFGDWFAGNQPVTATISFENAEAETILPTFSAGMLPVGRAYGDFVVTEVVAAATASGHGPVRIRSVTLQYSGSDQIDALAFSGDATWDFYALNPGDRMVLDAGEGEHLERHTAIAYYQSGPPWFSAADIAPETILLNGQVPIITGSAELITQDISRLGQSRVSAEPSINIVKEGRHHVWLTNLGHPQTITLEVGNQVIFENETYPLKWHDRFSLEEDGTVQTMGIFATGVSGNLRIFFHNLQAEARILLDGVPALTILPETRLVALKVQFDRFEAISILDPEDLENGGGWDVTTHGDVRSVNTHFDRHVMLTDLGQPQTVKLVVSDTVIFEDLAFPLNWRNRCFIVDGERQDMSIYTWGKRHRDKFMSVHLGKLTRTAKLYLDNNLVLQVSPPPEVEISLTGSLEFDGDPATFDGSFAAADRILLNGSLPEGYDIDKHYQRINSSGSPELQIGDRFGDMEVVDFTAGYDDHRITGLEFRYDGWKTQQINVYGDSRRNHLITTQEVGPGDAFVVDTREIEADRIYLKAGHRQRTVHLDGRWAAETGDIFLDCIVTDLTQVPTGPPHYIDLTLEYGGRADPVAITAYDGSWDAVIDTFDIDPTVDPIFKIDGSQRPDGHLGDNLVLEY